MLCFRVAVDDNRRFRRRQSTGCTHHSAVRATSWFAVDGSAARRRQSRRNRDLTEKVTKHQIHTTYVWTLSAGPKGLNTVTVRVRLPADRTASEYRGTTPTRSHVAHVHVSENIC